MPKRTRREGYILAYFVEEKEMGNDYQILEYVNRRVKDGFDKRSISISLRKLMREGKIEKVGTEDAYDLGGTTKTPVNIWAKKNLEEKVEE